MTESKKISQWFNEPLGSAKIPRKKTLNIKQLEIVADIPTLSLTSFLAERKYYSIEKHLDKLVPVLTSHFGYISINSKTNN